MSHGNTVWGILNMILPSIGGIGGGFFTWINSLSSAVVFFGVLGGIALGLFISNEISGRRIYKRIGQGTSKKNYKDKPLTQVIGQQYKNVTIILDWHEYINCEFTNCTFKWDVARFKFQNCKVNNAIRFETQSKIVGVTVDLLKVLHLLGEQEFADNWKQVSADYFKKD